MKASDLCTHPVCSLQWGQCQTAGGRSERFTDCPANAPETPTPGDRISRSDRAAQVSQPIREAISPPPPPGGVEELVEKLRRAPVPSGPHLELANLCKQAADALLSQARLLEERTRELETAVLDAAISNRLDDAGSPLTWKEVAERLESDGAKWRDAAQARKARAETAERRLEATARALDQILEQPKETMSDSKALRAIVRIARQALSNIRKEKETRARGLSRPDTSGSTEKPRKINTASCPDLSESEGL